MSAIKRLLLEQKENAPLQEAFENILTKRIKYDKEVEDLINKAIYGKE